MSNGTPSSADMDLLLQRSTHKTVTQYIVSSATGDQQLAILMNAIQCACKVVSHAIRRAGISNLYGNSKTTNATGDEVKKLDIVANDIWIHSLRNSGVCCLLVSEEEEEALVLNPEEGCPIGPFCVAFDPLDGSSNVDCNVSVGSIFSVYRRKTGGPCASSEDIVRPGTEIVAAGYSMYGAATELVITTGMGQPVERFQLDPSVGEFMFIEYIKFPADGGKKIYSCNEGNSKHWDQGLLDFVQHCKDRSYTARYVGSMVSDVHRSLLYGGIFFYPADKKSTKGKLRVLYEGFPMAMITENAGGAASTGMFQGKIGRVLEVSPEKIHDRCPIIMGCQRDVSLLLQMIQDAKA
ncbi:unnamed protein product [Amoebophrya sp. A25]|nr:unnamed protein product [Amoebophrya sp. A25]|eukprot:GSA25T00008308001.1